MSSVSPEGSYIRVLPADTTTDSETSLRSFSLSDISSISYEKLTSPSSGSKSFCFSSESLASSDSSVRIFLTKEDKEALKAEKYESDGPKSSGDESKAEGFAKEFARVDVSDQLSMPSPPDSARRMPWSKSLKLLIGHPEEQPNAADGKSIPKVLSPHENLGMLLHPLQSSWVLWYLKNRSGKPWEQCLHPVASFDTIEGFWMLYNAVQPPSGLNWNSDYYVFRMGIKPMWEDEANRDGGRWVIKDVRADRLDQHWLDLLLTMVGGGFEQNAKGVCGAAVSMRQKGDKIALWTQNASNDVGNLAIGNTLKRQLNMPDRAPLRYEAHEDTLQRNGSCVKQRLVLPLRYGLPTLLSPQ